MGAGAIIGSGLLGAASSIFGAQSAASAQKKAAQTAANTQLGMYNTMTNLLAPYRAVGDIAASSLASAMPSLIQGQAVPNLPAPLTQAELEQTPGYQFTLKQGLKATQNSAAARGLGTSGAALKGAGEYATGLADKTYLDQWGVRKDLWNMGLDRFNMGNTNSTNMWNRLLQGATLGANAAAGVGQGGLTAGQSISNSLMAAGNAQAAAYNAAGTAGQNLGNNVGAYYLYNSIFNPTKSGSGGFFGSGSNPYSSGLYASGGSAAP